MKLVTAAQMKKLEEETDKSGISYAELMGNAGWKLAKRINHISEKNSLEKNIVFLCGSGNNGGDCFVAGYYMANLGYKVIIALVCGEPKTQISVDAFFKLAEASNITILDNHNEIYRKIQDTAVIVDGVFGTGFHGQLNEEIKLLFSAKSTAIKIAVDIPSGGNANTGVACEGTFKADYTVTFEYEKFGIEQYPLKSYCGKTYTEKIGIPAQLYNKLDYKIETVTEERVSNIIPAKKPDSHKGNFGKLLNIVGSERMCGAGIMSSLAGLRCGVGLMTIATAENTIPSMLSAHLFEAVYLPLKADKQGFILYEENFDLLINQCKKSTAVLIGCGLGKTESTKKIVCNMIKNAECPIILDADGINCIADSIDIIKERKAEMILTPHPSEFARITGLTTAEVQQNRLKYSSEFAKKYGVTLILKGAGTIIATPHRAYVNTTGNAGMSKGGSGDILSGMIASFATQGISVENASVMGVYLHGKAGDMASEKHSKQSMLPTDMIEEFSEIFLAMNL